MNQRQLELIEKRNRRADAAWDKALEPARRSLRSPARVPYPEAAKAALAAYDEVIAQYRPLIWPG
jgi:hypothetical protein